MHFQIIQGGLAGRPQQVSSRTIVEEARRTHFGARLRRLQGADAGDREPIPKTIERLRLQIEFVALKLSALAAPPPDFADDGYWPQP